jgi:hypothetical protein
MYCIFVLRSRLDGAQASAVLLPFDLPSTRPRLPARIGPNRVRPLWAQARAGSALVNFHSVSPPARPGRFGPRPARRSKACCRPNDLISLGEYDCGGFRAKSSDNYATWSGKQRFEVEIVGKFIVSKFREGILALVSGRFPVAEGRRHLQGQRASIRVKRE